MLIYWEFSYECNVFIEQCLVHVVALCEVHLFGKNLVPMMHNNPEVVILVKFSHGCHVLILYAVSQLILSSRVKSVFLHITLKVGYNLRKFGMTIW